MAQAEKYHSPAVSLRLYSASGFYETTHVLVFIAAVRVLRTLTKTAGTLALLPGNHYYLSVMAKEHLLYEDDDEYT